MDMEKPQENKQNHTDKNENNNNIKVQLAYNFEVKIKIKEKMTISELRTEISKNYFLTEDEYEILI